MSATTDLGEILREHGYRLTSPRWFVWSVLRSAAGHLTADEIIDYVQTRVKGVNKSTIYRTLELLEDLGCVYRSRLGDHFIYHHAEGGHHHHVVCRACGRSVDLDDDLFESVERTVSERSGFQVGFTHVVMRGLCAECAEREAKGEGCN